MMIEVMWWLFDGVILSKEQGLWELVGLVLFQSGF